jgi:peptidoglycan/LPS O-acetylase OafA/YrhL
MIDAVTPSSHNYKVVDIIAQLLMFNNLMPDPDHVIWPGPYWFFGVMLQLYIVYRLLLYRSGWKYTVGAVVACWLLQIFCDPEGDTLNWIRYNFMGGVLPFGAGLLYARYGKEYSRPVYAAITLTSAALIFFFSYDYQLWFFIPIFVCSFSVALIKVIPSFQGVAHHPLHFSLEWMGEISAALFVCHPITRKIFIPISQNGDIYTGLLLYIVASIAIAWLFKELLKRIPSPKIN